MKEIIHFLSVERLLWPEIALILAWGAMVGIVIVVFFELFDYLLGE